MSVARSNTEYDGAALHAVDGLNGRRMRVAAASIWPMTYAGLWSLELGAVGRGPGETSFGHGSQA